MSSTAPDQSTADRLIAEHGPGLTLGKDCDLPDDLVVEIDSAAHLTIGDRVSIRRGATIQVHRGEDRRTLSVGFYGTSIMEHLEAFNTRLSTQADLPEIGATVTVEGWRQRGWVHRLALSLRADHPHLSFDIRNHGEGGATSRDIAAIVETDRAKSKIDYDLVFLGCGINDVWRRFQNRMTEAVDLPEYTQHLNTMLEQLTGYCRQIVVISETPFGPIEDPATVAEMNAELARYNTAAQKTAAAHGALFLDVWSPFTALARQLPPSEETSGGLWSDGIHLSDLGDTVLLQQAQRLLTEHQVLDKLSDSWSATVP